MPSITDIYLRVFEAIKDAFRVKIVDSEIPIGGADPVGLKNIVGVEINPSTEETLSEVKNVLLAIKQDTANLQNIGIMTYDPDFGAFLIKTSE